MLLGRAVDTGAGTGKLESILAAGACSRAGVCKASAGYHLGIKTGNRFFGEGESLQVKIFLFHRDKNFSEDQN